MNRNNLDFTALEGTNCYCSPASAELIRQTVSHLPLEGFHQIGTGDYHYLTLFWLERIREPFCLVLFDHHPDDQPDAFGAGLLSCGSWVAEARRLPQLRHDVWIRDAAGLAALDALPDLPVYVSVDLDVLSPAFARTNWDQGEMTLPELVSGLRHLRSARRIIGVDLCGGLTEQKGASPEDLALNARTGEALFGIFRND